jgi:hypothetical protein
MSVRYEHFAIPLTYISSEIAPPVQLIVPKWFGDPEAGSPRFIRNLLLQSLASVVTYKRSPERDRGIRWADLGRRPSGISEKDVTQPY